MDMVVCMKQTFDTEEKIEIAEGQIQEDGVEFVINPYDEYAIEQAIQLKEEHGGEVTVISYGPDRVESALRTTLAMGADRAILIEEEDSLSADESTVSKILAGVIKDRSFDLILAGNFAVDSSSGQVAIRLAEELDIDHVGSVTGLQVSAQGGVSVERDVEGDLMMIESKLPLVMTCQQGLNEPRYPSLPGIMKAKKKPLERVRLEELGIDPAGVKAKSTVVDQFLPPKKKAGKILEGDTEEQVKALSHLLREEAKII